MLLFTEPLHRRYYASWFSFAHCISILFNICLIFVPFFLGYPSDGSGGIWLKEDIYREQPNVAYNYKVIFLLTVKDINSGNINERFFSTISSMNESRLKSIQMATIRSYEIDIDNDGIKDKLQFNAVIPLLPQETIVSFQALLFFDYQLQTRAKISMESLAYIHKTFPFPCISYTTVGNLQFRQSSSLHIRRENTNMYVDEPLIYGKFKNDNASLIIQSKDTSMKAILEKYSQRNFASDYVELYPLWTSDITTYSSSVSKMMYKQFNFTSTINYPIQDIRYIPNVIEVLKDAWIKYFSLAVIVGFFLKKIASFVFFHQM